MNVLLTDFAGLCCFGMGALLWATCAAGVFFHVPPDFTIESAHYLEQTAILYWIAAALFWRISR